MIVNIVSLFKIVTCFALLTHNFLASLAEIETKSKIKRSLSKFMSSRVEQCLVRQLQKMI